jgi:hypothetical protein
MSRALGSVLLMMFGGHGGSREQDLRERPEQEMRMEEKPVPAPCKAKATPSHPRLIGPFTLQPCR